MKRRNLLTAFAWGAASLALAAPFAQSAQAADAPGVAFVYLGNPGDAGWTFAHDKARKIVAAEYGDKIVTSFVENVPEAADAERVLRDMIGQGNKLIFGTTFGYMEPMLKVAADNPEIKFEHATGYKMAANMRTYDSRTYEGAYLTGIVAGKMTKTNNLGVVASIPIPWKIAALAAAAPPAISPATPHCSRHRFPRPVPQHPADRQLQLRHSPARQHPPRD